jgi:site-specific DNA-methyltransferase (adenine-specific)
MKASEKDRRRQHPMQKPIALMSWIIELYANPGDTILDPYMGSGPTLKAARLLELPAIGIEIEERYCEQVARELDQLTIFDAPATLTQSEQVRLFND